MIAFDLGTKSSGVAWADGSDTYVHRGTDPGARLAWWHDTYRSLLLPHCGGHVAVEAPFIHHAHPSSVIPLAELHGVFRYVAHHAGCRLWYCPPSLLKHHATGKGNADKDAMMAAAAALRPDERIGSTDEADAICLYGWLTAQVEADT